LYAATVQARVNAEALEAQAALMVSGQALATSCSSTTSKPC
jgi:hypothetical protein